jgi:hypothetical protein
VRALTRRGSCFIPGMQSTKIDPYSPQELECRFQELRAQRARAKQLFRCYADEIGDDEELPDDDDAFLAYYAGRERP